MTTRKRTNCPIIMEHACSQLGWRRRSCFTNVRIMCMCLVCTLPPSPFASKWIAFVVIFATKKNNNIAYTFDDFVEKQKRMYVEVSTLLCAYMLCWCASIQADDRNGHTVNVPLIWWIVIRSKELFIRCQTVYMGPKSTAKNGLYVFGSQRLFGRDVWNTKRSQGIFFLFSQHK